jgi:hypothetical protein
MLPSKKVNKNFRKVINTSTLEVFDTILAAAKSINMNSRTLKSKLNGGNNNTDLLLLTDYESGKISEKKRGNMKYILDTESGVFYNSLAEAKEYYPFSYSFMQQMLNANSRVKNRTNLIYA